MKIIPLLKCRDMKQAITFYTGILDFTLKYTDASSDDWVVDLVNGEAEMQLTILESPHLFGSVVNVSVEDVDSLFTKYRERGLDISGKEGSPVHQGPLNQSWGVREFYVTDTDGNTLRFGQPFQKPKASYKNAWPYQKDNMNLPVKNVASALSFYENIFDFKLVSRSNTPFISAVLERDNIKIGLVENGGDPSQDGCFFEVDNIEAAFQELKLNGLKKDVPEFSDHKHGDTSWKVFFVSAPDGLCYCIGEKQN